MSVKALVLARDGLRCRYCRKPVRRTFDEAPDQLTFDHVVPRSRGGQNTVENLVVACRTCNRYKGSRVQRPRRV